MIATSVMASICTRVRWVYPVVDLDPSPIEEPEVPVMNSQDDAGRMAALAAPGSESVPTDPPVDVAARHFGKLNSELLPMGGGGEHCKPPRRDFGRM